MMLNGVEVRDILSDVINKLREFDPSNKVIASHICDELTRLGNEALKYEDRLLNYVVSTINLIHNLTDHELVILESIRSKVLMHLIKSPFTANLPEDVCLQGPSVDCVENGSDSSAHGATMMRLDVFAANYAHGFGCSKFDLDATWRKIENGNAVPIDEIHLNGANGIVWFTDHRALHAHCCLTNMIDGNQAYDDLALDWTAHWHEYTPSGKALARAVVLCCPVVVRAMCSSGVKMPTAVDAWGNLLFVPSLYEEQRIWPDITNRTINPISGNSEYVEAIHGKVSVQVGHGAAVKACGDVCRDQWGDRLVECGDRVFQRSMLALTDLLGV